MADDDDIGPDGDGDGAEGDGAEGDGTAGGGPDDDGNPRIGWRHEWATIALLWAMIVWVSVTILGTRGAAQTYVTLADAVVVAFVLVGGALGTLTIVRAARIPMLSAPLPLGAAALDLDAEPEEPEAAGDAEKAEEAGEPEKAEKADKAEKAGKSDEAETAETEPSGED